MFQFPGFALFVLCVQTKSTCLNRRSSTVRATPTPAERPARSVFQTADNRRLSGGFPHSDIPGSKGALASPGLIAECHVLHRLLLPRHPPNALIALDPIQKKTGPFARGMVRSPTCPLAFCRKSNMTHAAAPAKRLRQVKGRNDACAPDPPSRSVSSDLERLLSLPCRFAARGRMPSHNHTTGRAPVRTWTETESVSCFALSTMSIAAIS